MARPQRCMLALAALVLAAPACKSACDETGLRTATEALQTHSLDGQQRGIETLSQACPSLPPSLAKSLSVEFSETPADVRAELLVSNEGDPTWRALLERTCPLAPDPGAGLHGGGRDPSQHDRLVRERCELDRYGLLEPNDPFVSRDLVPMMLYEWLVTGRVDPGVAKSVVRPLLSAHATAEELEAMCRQRDLACTRVFEAWGLGLPSSSTDQPLSTGVELRITPTSLVVDGTPMLPLVEGKPAPEAFPFHLSPPLAETLRTRAEIERTSRGISLEDWDARAIVMADRATPFSTIADTLFTGTKAGFTSFELVVHQGHRTRAINIRPGRAWMKHRLHPHAEQLDVVFRIHRDSVEAELGAGRPMHVAELPGCEDPAASCSGLDALRTLALNIKRSTPHSDQAHLQIDGDVPLQTIVRVADTLRGEDCSMATLLQGELPDECLFYWVHVDTWPPLYYAIGRTGTLTLGDATVRRHEPGARDAPKNKALLAAYAAARDEITQCLIDHPPLLRDLDDEDELVVTFERSPGDPKRSQARVDIRVEYSHEPQLAACVLAPLGADAAPVFPPGEYDDVQVELVIPVRFWSARGASSK